MASHARASGTDAGANGTVLSLERARACAYLSSIARASEGVGVGDGLGGDRGVLGGWLDALGLPSVDELAARAMESAGTGTSGRERAPGESARLLPEVTMKDLEGYLRQTRDRYAEFVEQWEQNEARENGSAAATRARLYGLREGARDLSTVPSLFFEETFELHRPETFSSACAGLDQESVRNLARAATELQEDLSAHLDTVEQYLISEISEKSDEFFVALEELHNLHESMAETQRQVVSMRKSVKELGENLVKPGLYMTKLRDKRDNLEGLTETFTKISALQQMRNDMDVFVESTDYSRALQIAGDIGKTLAEDKVLAELTCFRKLPEHVVQTTNKVRHIMIQDFVHAASLEKDARHVVSRKALERLYETAKACGLEDSSSDSKVAPQCTEKNKVLLEKTLPPLISLMYSGSSLFCDALEAWSSAISEDVRIVERSAMDIMLNRVTKERRQSVPSMDEAVFDSAYAAAIRNLPADVFAEMLSALTDTFNVYFVHVTELRKLIRGIIGADDVSPESLEEMDEGLIAAARQAASSIDYTASQTASATLSEALNKVIDVAQGRFAKLLGLRAPMNVASSSREFMKITEATNAFLEVAETLGKHRCLSLRTTLANQSKVFVREQHSAATSRLVNLLECETWALAKLPERFQALVDALMEGSNKLPEVDNENIGNNSCVVIYGEEFHPVNSAVLLLQMLVDYLRLARQDTSLSTEVTHRTIDLIKQYNTGVCQLILGAGAMQVSRLKSITAKHLCLSQQSVSLFAAILPQLRDMMCALIEGPRLVLLRQEFDRMLRDLRLHVNEIHDKLVSIMCERVEFHLHRLSSIIKTRREEQIERESSPTPSDFATALTKETGTLRRIVNELLNEEDQTHVLGRVRASSCAAIVSKVKALEADAGDDGRIIAQLSTDVKFVHASMLELPMTVDDEAKSFDALGALATELETKTAAMLATTDAPEQQISEPTIEQPDEDGNQNLET